MKEITSEEQKEILLEMLKYLDEICRKNNINYFLSGGTLLGAIRHKGFIPWDDDIDVLMPYADAKKLIYLQHEFGVKYFVQSKETDPDYRSIAMRVRDCDTTCIEGNEVDLNINKGIYVDIYPYYECSNNKLIRVIDILRSNLLKVLVNNRPPVNHGKVLALVARGILTCIANEQRLKIISELEKRLCSVRGNEVLDYYGQDVGLFTAISYPKEWFSEPKKLEFEGRIFNGASEPEKYMEKRYGDYMKLPPIEDQVVHHTYIKIDPYKSYEEYMT